MTRTPVNRWIVASSSSGKYRVDDLVARVERGRRRRHRVSEFGNDRRVVRQIERVVVAKDIDPIRRHADSPGRHPRGDGEREERDHGVPPAGSFPRRAARSSPDAPDGHSHAARGKRGIGKRWRGVERGEDEHDDRRQHKTEAEREDGPLAKGRISRQGQQRKGADPEREGTGRHIERDERRHAWQHVGAGQTRQYADTSPDGDGAAGRGIHVRDY